MVFRPATPGFIVTLTATILLAVVSFNVPLLKSIYFLKASFSTGSDTGVITFGTLGYCLQLSSGTSCSKPSVGYEFNPNSLLGDSISFAQIPTVVVKWITYALVLHIVALVLAAIASVLGLLAHVRELSMTCFSSCVSGFGASIALIAFIFDLVLFFLARTRINSVKGGSATIGISIWLTLAAWVLLFFSGCFFGLGRCCIGRRPRGPRDPKEDNWNAGGGGANNNYAEQMRLDAVKAEADRKARQKLGEGGLPAFQEHEVTKPLNYNSGPQYLEEDEDLHSPYRDHHAIGAGVAGAGAAYAARQGASASYRGGYAQAAPGTRAVDEYYSPSNNDAQSLYPPQAGHQQYESSIHSQRPSTRTASNYAPSTYEAPATHVQSPTGHNQYLSTIGESGHSQYPSGREYGHGAGGTTYHSAISHQQYPTAYSQTDPYAQPQATSLNPDTYNATSTLPVTALADPYASHQTAYPPTSPPQAYAQGYPTTQTYASGATSYYTAQTQAQPERSYTLGGGGYGTNVVPSPSPPHADPGPQYAFGGAALSNPRPDSQGTSYFPRAENQGFSNPHSPATFSPQRGNADPSIPQHEDSPPGYEPGPLHQATTTWPEKR